MLEAMDPWDSENEDAAEPAATPAAPADGS
jgi:hypothetical protein